jgi:hypothetical protein
VVWDIEGRKHPSIDPNADGTEIYLPGLPSSSYEYFPKVNNYVKSGEMTTEGDPGIAQDFTKDVRRPFVTSVDSDGQKLEVTSATNVGDFGVKQTILGITAGDKISVKFEYKYVNTQSTNVRIRIYFYDSTGTIISNITTDLLPEQAAHTIYKWENITVPANTAYAAIVPYIRASAAYNSAGIVYYRNLVMIKGERFTEGTEYEHNPYDNQGFDKFITHDTKTLARFYEPRREYYQHAFGFMGGYEPNSKVSVIGTYRSNSGQHAGNRICIFGSSDGGRSWYNIYEFAGPTGTYVHDINTSGELFTYNAESFVVKERSLNVPSQLTKEPADLFTLGTPIVVQSITAGNPTIVTTATAHGLDRNSVIYFEDNPGSAQESPEWAWLINDSVGVNSGGNGKFFVPERINDTQFSLHDYVHAINNNLSCRHIHHINRIKDGWIVGTGEEYPSGWILYIQMKKADSFERQYAYQDFGIYRLNSTENSLQRSLGVLLLDDADSTVIFASDSGSIQRENLTLPTGRTTEISQNSTGVFKGKLSQVDNIADFEVIFEAEEPAYFFKEKLGAWIFIGQRGEFGISLDRGNTWYRETLPAVAYHFYGISDNFVLIDDYLIQILN